MNTEAICSKIGNFRVALQGLLLQYINTVSLSLIHQLKAWKRDKLSLTTQDFQLQLSMASSHTICSVYRVSMDKVLFIESLSNILNNKLYCYMFRNV